MLYINFLILYERIIMRSYIKALIFDLDGTLADTIPAISEAVNMTLEKLGFPCRTEAEIRGYIGRGPRHLITEALPITARDEDTVIRALALYDKTYAQTYMHTDSLYAGLEEVILELSKYYKIAVLSNKQDAYVKALVRQLLPEGICELAMGSLDGVPAKPEATVAHRLTDALGVNPHDCVLIGDSDVDILTAQNAEFDVISVSWGYASKTKLLLHGADTIVNSPEELLEYFK